MMNDLVKCYNEDTLRYEYVVDADTIVFWFGISKRKLQSLCMLKRTRPDMPHPFPAAIKIADRNHWFLEEVRHWQLIEARRYQQRLDSGVAYDIVHNFWSEGYDTVKDEFRENMFSNCLKCDLWESGIPTEPLPQEYEDDENW